MQDSIFINHNGRNIQMVFEPFDDSIDIDELTKISYDNIFAEILTVSALLNRAGIWKAEADNDYADFKLDLNVYIAQIAERLGKETKSVLNSKGEYVQKYYTISEIENKVTIDEGVQLRRKKALKLKRECDILDSLYWAVKSKADKLNKLTDKLRPEEFEKEIVIDKMNSISFKIKEALFSMDKASNIE